MNNSQIDILQPELKHNSELKVDVLPSAKLSPNPMLNAGAASSVVWSNGKIDFVFKSLSYLFTFTTSIKYSILYCVIYIEPKQ